MKPTSERMLKVATERRIRTPAIWTILKDYADEVKQIEEKIKTMLPAWICEFCFACLLEGNLPEDWDLVWQSAVCPSCQEKVKEDGGYFIVNGGAYSNGRRDPREKETA